MLHVVGPVLGALSLYFVGQMTAVIHPCAVRDSRVTRKKRLPASQNPAYWQLLEILKNSYKFIWGDRKIAILAISRISNGVPIHHGRLQADSNKCVVRGIWKWMWLKPIRGDLDFGT